MWVGIHSFNLTAQAVKIPYVHILCSDQYSWGSLAIHNQYLNISIHINIFKCYNPYYML